MFANGEQRPRSVKQHVCSYVYLTHFVIPSGPGSSTYSLPLAPAP